MRVLKQIGLGLACLLLLAVVVTGALFAISTRQVSGVHAPDEPALAIPTDPATVTRGRHLATSVGSCIDCHAPDLGGRVIADMGPIGIAVGSNLTRGRGSAVWSYKRWLVRDDISHE